MNPPTSAADLLAAAAGRRQRAADVKLPEKFLSEFWEADGASADVVLGGVVDRDFIYDEVRTIRDPELPRTLEELEVVLLDDVRLWQRGGLRGARVRFFPTVPHCHLAPTIGLCIRAKLARSLPPDVKLDLAVVPGSHATAADVTKQINDKDRAAAALDDPRIRVLVHRCIGDLGAHG